ncbi:MAG: hypothetical protein WA182_08685 [Candidatus Sulfotelmatobacter sp.]
MSDLRDLLRIMAEAKEEVERWDDWMKNQEPEPGDSSRKWLLDDEDEAKARVA